MYLRLPLSSPKEKHTCCRGEIQCFLNVTNFDISSITSSHQHPYRSTSAQTQAKRYFLDTLKLNATEFKLSVLTSPKLSPGLQRLKKHQGLFLVQFEEAPVSLDPYTRLHAFETQQFLVDSIAKHYTEVRP